MSDFLKSNQSLSRGKLLVSLVQQNCYNDESESGVEDITSNCSTPPPSLTELKVSV